MHAELRELLESTLGPEPWPGLVYRRGNFMRGQLAVFLAESPPLSIIYGSAGLLASCTIAIWHATDPVAPFVVVLVPLAIIAALSALMLVRGLVRIGWWRRARRIALEWCAEHQHVMPHDLRW